MKIGENTKFWHKELSNIGDCVIGSNCVIHAQVAIHDGVVIGDNVKIQGFSFIPKGVIIEDNVFIGPRVTFTNDKYPPSEEWSPTLVKRGASLGAGVTVVPGVTIGENSFIGAGSLVTKDIPANEIWFGAPAKFIRKKS